MLQRDVDVLADLGAGKEGWQTQFRSGKYGAGGQRVINSCSIMHSRLVPGPP